MIEWKPLDRDNFPNNGQYLVYCVAPNFDSDWVDIARCTDGKWGNFKTPISHDSRVRFYAIINYPNVQKD